MGIGMYAGKSNFECRQEWASGDSIMAQLMEDHDSLVASIQDRDIDEPYFDEEAAYERMLDYKSSLRDDYGH